MAFNFGAFAGGLSQGIQAGQKLALEQEQLQNARDKATADLKKAEADSMSKVAKEVVDHNKTMSDLTIKMNNAKDENEYNTYAAELNSSVESFTKLYQAQTENGLLPKQAGNILSQARLQTSEPIAKVSIKDYNGKDIETYLPQSMANEKDSLVLMENNKIGIAQVGEDGKIASYQPTDYSPVKFKAEKEKGSFGVIGGKEGYYTDEALFNATQAGLPVERSKDKPAQTNTTIINEAKKDENIKGTFALAEQYRNGTTPYNAASANLAEAMLFKENPKMADISKAVREDISNEDNSIKALTRMKGNLDTLIASGKYDNQYANFVNVLTTKFTPESWSTKSPSEKEEVYKLLRSQGEMGDALAQYLKANSGTAASEKEAMRNAVNLFGSTSDFASLKSKSESVGGFIDARKASIINKANDALDLGLVGTGGKILNQYRKKDDNSENKDTPKSTVKEIIQNGWVYDAETKKPIRKAN